MIKLRNFEVENDFNLNKENYNFESIGDGTVEIVEIRWKAIPLKKK